MKRHFLAIAAIGLAGIAQAEEPNPAPTYQGISIDLLTTRHSKAGKPIVIYMVTLPGEAPRLACESESGHEVYCDTGEEP